MSDKAILRQGIGLKIYELTVHLSEAINGDSNKTMVTNGLFEKHNEKRTDKGGLARIFQTKITHFITCYVYEGIV